MLLMLIINERLREARKKAGLTQAELAEMIEMSTSAIAHYEAGSRPPSLKTIDKIAAALKVDRQSLLGVASDSSEQPAITQNLGREVATPTIVYVKVPIYGAVSANEIEYSDSNMIQIELLPVAMGDRKQWGRYIQGSSMGPEFRDGDIAIFDDRQAEEGHGVHAFKPGIDVFRILRTIDGERWLCPTNTEDADEPVRAGGWLIKGVCYMRLSTHEKGVTDQRRYPSGYRHNFS